MELTTKPEINLPENKIVEKLKELLEESIKSSLPKEKEKFALLFSGGIDSSIIAKILKNMEADFVNYTVIFNNNGFKEPEDLSYSIELSKELEIPLMIIKVNEKEIESALKILINIIEKPHPVKLGIALPEYFGLKAAKEQGINFVYSGMAADTLFAGFSKYKEAKNLNEKCREGIKEIYEKRMKRELAISKETKESIIFPFLHEDLVSFALKIPAKYKINKGQEKYILRKVGEDLGLPEYVVKRKKKAIQYGSNFQKALKKIAKKHGHKKIQDYLNSI